MDREETISDERIKEELKDLMQKNAGRAFEVYLWPESPSDIPDNMADAASGGRNGERDKLPILFYLKLR